MAHRACECRQQVPRRAYACHMHLPRREDEFIRGTEQRVGACCPPKMPRRVYEFRQARPRRAYEFSPSARGEILQSIRTCLDAGPAFSLHVGTTCTTRTAQHGVASAAQHARGCNRGPTICAHARMLRNRVAGSPPESCCSKLMSSASHCRDGDMAFVAHGHLVLVIATSRGATASLCVPYASAATR